MVESEEEEEDNNSNAGGGDDNDNDDDANGDNIPISILLESKRVQSSTPAVGLAAKDVAIMDVPDSPEETRGMGNGTGGLCGNGRYVHA